MCRLAAAGPQEPGLPEQRPIAPGRADAPAGPEPGGAGAAWPGGGERDGPLASWAVTAEHYARWVPNAECIEPARLGKSDVWPDVLARLEQKEHDCTPATGSEGA